jgi:hypothetical protein
MSEPIVYIDRSDIREGKLEEVKAATSELVRFVDTHEPQLIAYAFYMNEEATQMTLVAIHPDSKSMEFHMETAGPSFRRFTELITLRTIEVYGRPSDKVLEQLQQKAEMLGGTGSLVVQERHRGFIRFASANA